MSQSMKIVVLMSCYNGGTYLKEQLNSLLNQTIPCTQILIRDDGSSDDTPAILHEYCNQFPIIKWLKDDRGHLGIRKSYNVLFQSAAQFQVDYLLIADQDDVWLPKKIEKSLVAMQKINLDKPALIFTDVKIVDARLKLLSYSFKAYQRLQAEKPITLKKILLYSPALGCTMIFNRSLLHRVVQYNTKNINPDKWLLICAILYGTIDYLSEATLLYRQHENNLTGAFYGIKRKLFSFGNRDYLKTRYQSAIDQARDILQVSSLEEKQRKLINNFIKLFTAPYPVRIINYFRFCTTPPHWKRKFGLFLSLFFKYY